MKDTIKKIQEQYAEEKKELVKQYNKKLITKNDYNDSLEQLNKNEQMDITDAFLEGSA